MFKEKADGAVHAASKTLKSLTTWPQANRSIRARRFGYWMGKKRTKIDPTEMELGVLYLSNTPLQNYYANWATDGLLLLSAVIAENRDARQITANAAEEEYVNDVFALRPYCWCDGSEVGHEDGCPPNFEHFSTGLVITWYKHAGRSITANQSLTYQQWGLIISHCLTEIFYNIHQDTDVTPSVTEEKELANVD